MEPGMISYFVRVAILVAIIVSVSEVSRRSPRLGAFLLTLPIVSILAFGTTWFANHDLRIVSRMARETLILVPLGLPFFLPLAFAERLELGFWTAMGIGLILASASVGLLLWFAQRAV
jgi:hypothetical protein